MLICCDQCDDNYYDDNNFDNWNNCDDDIKINLAYQKGLGKFTKVLGIEKTPLPPVLGKIPK